MTPPYSDALQHHIRTIRHRSPYHRSQILIWLLGCVIFSTGGYLFIYSDLGTDPLDVLSLGLVRHLPITIGIAQGLYSLLCIAVWSIWCRCRPVVMPFITFFGCGSLIDLYQILQPARFLPVSHFTIMIMATLLCAYASALIIMSGVGIRAMDLVAIAMVDKWHWPLWVAKMSMEGLLILAGFLLGGPVGIGTLFFLGLVDTLIQPFMRLNAKGLGMQNLGMPMRAAASLNATDSAS